MAVFPVLKSGAVAQAPLTQSIVYDTEIIRFCGGGEQRYPLRGQAARRWRIQLSALDEGELQTLLNFYEVHAPYGMEFEFRDPVSGELLSNCIFAGDTFEQSMNGEHRGECIFRIEQKVSVA